MLYENRIVVVSGYNRANDVLSSNEQLLGFAHDVKNIQSVNFNANWNKVLLEVVQRLLCVKYNEKDIYKLGERLVTTQH